MAIRPFGKSNAQGKRFIVILAAMVSVAYTGLSDPQIALATTASSSAGTVGNASGVTFPDPPLTPLASVPLSTANGTIQAVVYDGANTTAGGSLSQTLTGFTVPASPFSTHATAIEADGQLSGNGFTLVGTGTPLTDNNAFAGADPHPSGWSYGGLWDTRNYDVTSAVSAGDTSVGDVVSGAGDCLTSVAQVLATGPSAAFASAGYLASGVGLRNQGSGQITISGVPRGASVARAYLFWANISPTDPGQSININGTGVNGSTDGTDASPCWGEGNIYTHSADVTSVVKGNGTYTLSGYATGTADGNDPWSAAVAPMMEGASLVLFYSGGSAPRTSTYTYCARRTQPTAIGRSNVNFIPCMKVTDDYNGTRADSVRIQPPADSRAHGGCPSFIATAFSSLICKVTGTSNHAAGSSVVDQVTMRLDWDNNVFISAGQYGSCILTLLETDTMTMTVTTSASGARKGSSLVKFVSSPDPIFNCS